MIRLTWRQFRIEALVGLVLLAAVAVTFAVTGPHLLAVYRLTPNQVANTYHGLQVGIFALLLLGPALVGVFFGAPLIARELETGTFRLVWTQSVTRARWLLVKLVGVGLASSLLAGGLTLMAAWWANPINLESQNRFSPALFGMFGIVPFGYGLFAFALGATAGVLFRRTLPAMAATLLGYVGVRVGVTYGIRPYFEAPLKTLVTLSPDEGGGFIAGPNGLHVVPPNFSIPNAWVLASQLVDKAGKAPSSGFVHQACPWLPTGAQVRVPGSKGVGAALHLANGIPRCLHVLAVEFRGLATYQPASRFWPFQGFETALFVLLSLALGLLTLFWARRRLS